MRLKESTIIFERKKMNNCETCAGGTDLGPNETCSVCKTTRIITGYRKLEYPMTEEDKNRKIPITKLTD